jgi:uncharacterized tellurite resistance protein B-like protein
MANDRQTALLKVLAAAAWADGRLDLEEINRIKELMLRYDLGPDGVREVEALLERPVSYDQCEQLTRDLMQHLKSPSQRDDALSEIGSVLAADGVVDPAERELLENLKGIMDAMTSVDGFMNRIAGIFRGAFGNRRPKSDPGELANHLKNAVLQRLDDVSAGEWRNEADVKTLNFHTLFGAVLGRVADVEGGISDAELESIRTILAGRFELRSPVLDWVVQSVKEASDARLDRQGLLSEFNRVSDSAQRKHLLDACFAVAASDGSIAPEEFEELRLISNFLWLDPRDFHAVRSKWEAALKS